MDLNSVKGLLAENFVKLLMNNNKFNATKPDKDYGVDLKINRVLKTTTTFGKTRYIDDEIILDIQIKCTTESKIRRAKSGLGWSFKVEAKTYEDLLRRRDENHLIKLILIVFILPSGDDDWLRVLDEKIELSKYAYWYYPSDDDTLDKLNGLNEKSRIRIELLNENKITANFLTVFETIYADRIQN
ncbi:DUF4365 domain-containing protein [Sphingobacterium siyangense]|uniref:DUF4365 domain-containing protein n=1 Tax=Sphingobacterium siyangense TaxID=459529 RepID=UPI003DA31BF2